jgi:GDP-4-dehydro-6-deoxy-D-mannose reductase
MYAVHAGGTLNVLEAARRLDPKPRVLITSTGDAYRPDPARLPFDEDAPQAPENPYAAAKVAAEAMGRAWFVTYGLPVVRVRLFNVLGPGQDERFVASSFAMQVAAIALGRQAPRIEVGDLRVARDFVDYRDAVEAMRVAAEEAHPGEVYNVCSGAPRPIGDLLRYYLEKAGVAAEIVAPEHLARPGQAQVRYGSPARLEKDTAWRPQRRIEETLDQVFEWWVERLKG